VFAGSSTDAASLPPVFFRSVFIQFPVSSRVLFFFFPLSLLFSLYASRWVRYAAVALSLYFVLPAKATYSPFADGV